MISYPSTWFKWVMKNGLPEPTQHPAYDKPYMGLGGIVYPKKENDPTTTD